MGSNVTKGIAGLRLRSRTTLGTGINATTTNLPRVNILGARLLRFIFDGTGSFASDVHVFRWAQHPLVTSANENGGTFPGFTVQGNLASWSFDTKGPYVVCYVPTLAGTPVYTMLEASSGVVPGTATNVSVVLEVYE